MERKAKSQEWVTRKGVLVPKGGLPIVEESWPNLATFPTPVIQRGTRRNLVSKEVD